MGFWQTFRQQLREITDISAHIDTADAAQRIKNNIWFRGPNVWILAFSIVVASVGLNVNSTAVIIGAMLISPLMGPIIGIGYSFGTNDAPLLKQAAKNLLIMVAISLLASSLFFLVSPLRLVNPTELEARTGPTIYDVLIALFGGLAGIFETSRKDRGTVLSGVAIATALMPPLCTAGYGLAHWNMHFFLGAMYLFIINSVFIALATYATVRFLRFPQAEFIDAAKAKRQRAFITITAVAVIIPSTLTAVQLVRNTNYERKVIDFVSDSNTFSGRQYIYDYKVSHGREAELFLTGEMLDAASRERLFEAAEAHGIKRESLTLNEHSFRPGKDEETEKLIRGIYERSDLEIARKDERIRELEAQLQDIHDKGIPYSQIQREVNHSYPEISQLTITRGASTSADTSLVRDRTIVVAVSPKVMADKDRTDLEEWLKIRLQDTTVTVVNRTVKF